MSHISWRSQKRGHIIFKQCFTESDTFDKISVYLRTAIETIFTFNLQEHHKTFCTKVVQ